MCSRVQSRKLVHVFGVHCHVRAYSASGCAFVHVQYSEEQGFPGGSDGEESSCSAGDLGFNPRVGKISWRRARQSTPLFLPEKSHGQRSLVGSSPLGLEESDTIE